MPETIGSVVDRLQVTNLKMWWAQEALYKVRRMDFEQFLEWCSSEDGARELFEAFKMACDLNVQRNDLITDIDRAIDAAIRAGGAAVRDAHKSY